MEQYMIAFIRKVCCENILLMVILCIVCSCNNTKYLRKGETLFTGAKIKYVLADTSSKTQNTDLKEELQSIILPKPNSKILGLRVKLWFYNIAGKPTGKGLRYLIQNTFGEPPIYAKDVNFEKNNSIIINRLQNRGYFHGSSSYDTVTINKRTSAVFIVKPSVQYLIDSVSFPNDSSELSAEVRSAGKYSRLRGGNAYDLDVIKEERKRIDSWLKQKGYFFFNENYLLVKVDNNIGNQKVNMYMQVKPETPPKAMHPYHIGRVIIYADYNLTSDSAFEKRQTVLYDSMYTVDPFKKFHPRMYQGNIRFHPGDLYNRQDHNLTLSRLGSLGVYKFVKARYEKMDAVNDTMLTVYYHLSPSKTYSVKAQVSALTKSNNSNGTELTVSLKHNNTFRSAEQLSLSGFIGAEQQISGQQNVGTTRFGSNLDLSIPRIIGPVRFARNSHFVGKTKINLGYEYFRRSDLYTLNFYKASFGWQWNTSISTEHQLRPIVLNYVVPSGITPEFQKDLDTNITLSRSIERQFIIGSTYNFNYNSQAKPNNKKHNFYFNVSADVSGNILGLITGASILNGNEKKIFNTPFSQYIRGEAELRHYLSIGTPKKERKNQLVSRLLVGAGYGYGNSASMPFIKQFFIGGINSIRAYRARSLGPGTYYAGNAILTNTYLPDQPGDIKIEANTELRFKIVSILRGALFVDAGNIYTMRGDPARPGSQFSSDFLKQFAVGTGAGLRFDINFLVLRIDAAIPIRNTYDPNGPQWVLDKISFGDSQWRRENIVLNLAIGYPF